MKNISFQVECRFKSILHVMTFAYKSWALAVLLVAGTAHADIYAYVDDDGVTHYSNTQVDDRYTLFKREVEAPLSDSLPLPASKADLPKRKPESTTLVKRRKEFAKLVQKVAREVKIDPALLDAVITAESGYNPDAISPKGAMGLMQLIPATAERYGASDPLNPEQNLRAGAKYLRDLLKMFNQDLSLAIAAYNAGEGSVIRAGYAIPKFKETQAYVPKVLDHMGRAQGNGQVQTVSMPNGRVSVTLTPGKPRFVTGRY